MTTLCFTVYARPEPQGSMRAFVRKRAYGKQFAAVTHDNPKVRSFRQEASKAALVAMHQNGRHMLPRGVAVALQATFFLRKPKSAAKSVRLPTKRPDLSKLLRALEDALTGIVYEDDSQVQTASVSKFYGLPECTKVQVWPL